MIWSEADRVPRSSRAMVFVDTPIWLILLAFGVGDRRTAVPRRPRARRSRTSSERPEDISWANSLVTLGVHAGIADRSGDRRTAARRSPASSLRCSRSTRCRSSISLCSRSRCMVASRRSEAARTNEHAGLSGGHRVPVARAGAATPVDRVVRVRGRHGHGHGGRRAARRSVRLGRIGYGLHDRGWGLGSTLGAGVGRWMTARTEPVWMVFGAVRHHGDGARRGIRAAVPARARRAARDGRLRRPHDRVGERHDAAPHARRDPQPHHGGVRGGAVVRARGGVRRGRSGAAGDEPAGGVPGRGASARAARY